jgi:DNA-binding transcriptional LysR family regulator
VKVEIEHGWAPLIGGATIDLSIFWAVSGIFEYYIYESQMNDRFQSLLVFRRTARCGSFSQAARELGLSQSSVSRIVAELERDLGVSLLARTTRAVTPTDAGIDYLVRIEAILDALDEADHVVRGGGILKGLLRIGISSSFGLREVVPRLADFLEQHAELRVDVVMSDQRQDLVAEGIDIAFRLGAMPDSTMLARRLGEAPRILVAAPHYLYGRPPIATPEDLRVHSLIVGPGVAPPALEFRQGDRRVSVRAAGRITCAANEAATAVARAGLGITVSSLWGVSREIETGALIVVLPDWTLPSVELHAVFPPGRARSPAARAFADFFAAAIQNPQLPPSPDPSTPVGAS